jgi:hypothetical protein
LRRDGGQSSSFRSSCVSTSCGVFCIERRNIHAYMHACVCVFDDSLALWNKSRPVSHLWPVLLFYLYFLIVCSIWFWFWFFFPSIYAGQPQTPPSCHHLPIVVLYRSSSSFLPDPEFKNSGGEREIEEISFLGWNYYHKGESPENPPAKENKTRAREEKKEKKT